MSESNNLRKQYFVSQSAALTALTCWFPFMSRCVYTEVNYIKPTFKEEYKKYFSRFINSYKGIEPYFVAQFFYPIIDISTTQIAKILAKNNTPQFEHNLIAATITGAGSPILFNPLKAIIVATQNKQFNNSFQTINHIYNTGKFIHFYKGSTFFMIRNATFTPCLFILPNYFETKLNSYSQLQNTVIAQPISYLLSAAIAVTVSMPMDVYSSVSLSDPNKHIYKSNWSIIKMTYQKKGFTSLFAGLKWRLLATTIEFGIYNIAKKLYNCL